MARISAPAKLSRSAVGSALLPRVERFQELGNQRSKQTSQQQNRLDFVGALTRAAAVLFLLAALAAGPAAAKSAIGEGKRSGIGVATGYEHLTLTGKYYVQPGLGAQAFVGLANHGFNASVDAVFEPWTLYAISGGHLLAGVGGGVNLFRGGGSHDTGLHAIGQLGWHFADFPVEVMADWRPAYWLGRDADLTLVFVAVRWFF